MTMNDVRVLILGGSGMLGHKVWQHFQDRFVTFATVRELRGPFARLGARDNSRIIRGISAEDASVLERVFADVQPQVVVNCIGIVKQDKSAKDPIASITVNSLFPHHVARHCREFGARLIHLSTDCVFTGRKGNYSETDAPDAADLYGRSKLLGEVDEEGSLTIRTSMIGRELSGSHGLVEWFFSQQGKKVRGFKKAIFSGFTTSALADVIARIIVDHPSLSGLWHVSSNAISKFDLLTLVKQTYGLQIEIESDDDFDCDRSLDSSRFRAATAFQPPSWPEMIEGMRADLTPYEEIRTTNT
jgi:dTDP-4-dehydrorhamnose reductase